MKLTEKAEEILEEMWLQKNEKDISKIDLKSLKETDESAEILQLIKAGLIELCDSQSIIMTPSGKKRGEEIVRHHRLAERLMADVLDMPEGTGDEAACKVEHMLKRGLDERICTLLGHPRFCPHGSPIPLGPCCKEHRNSYMKLISTLAAMEDGERGIIAYLHTGQKGKLERLLALGVLPGQQIALIQKFPSFVFRLGETEMAVDKDLASSIHVRLGNEPPARRRWRRRGPFLR